MHRSRDRPVPPIAVASFHKYSATMTRMRAAAAEGFAAREAIQPNLPVIKGYETRPSVAPAVEALPCIARPVEVSE